MPVGRERGRTPVATVPHDRERSSPPAPRPVRAQPDATARPQEGIMSAPNVSASQIHSASSAEVEAQVRKDAAGLAPAEIDAIVTLVLKYGPSVYAAILKLFHVTPKS